MALYFSKSVINKETFYFTKSHAIYMQWLWYSLFSSLLCRNNYQLLSLQSHLLNKAINLNATTASLAVREILASKEDTQLDKGEDGHSN